MRDCLLWLLAALATVTFTPPPTEAKQPIRSVEGMVTRVSDGDTVNVQNVSGTKLRVRLYGIDAPETEKRNKKTGWVSKRGQPYGEESWRALETKVSGKWVKVEVLDIDRYRRLVSIIWLMGRNINREMVAEGLAWAYRQYLDTPYASDFIDHEDKARARGVGLWKQPNPEPPWEFRKRMRVR